MYGQFVESLAVVFCVGRVWRLMGRAALVEKYFFYSILIVLVLGLGCDVMCV